MSKRMLIEAILNGANRKKDKQGIALELMDDLNIELVLKQYKNLFVVYPDRILPSDGRFIKYYKKIISDKKLRISYTMEQYYSNNLIRV